MCIPLRTQHSMELEEPVEKRLDGYLPNSLLWSLSWAQVRSTPLPDLWEFPEVKSYICFT